jgi:hypothetical protein
VVFGPGHSAAPEVTIPSGLYRTADRPAAGCQVSATFPKYAAGAEARVDSVDAYTGDKSPAYGTDHSNRGLKNRTLRLSAPGFFRLA